jgi:protein-disulfide isomerase
VFVKITKEALTFIIVIVCVLGVTAFKAGSLRHHPSGSRPTGAFHAARIKGSSAAPVKILEFTDFQCPACARASAGLDELFQAYAGKISIEHKHYPLKMHANALAASVVADCSAGQGKFWPMHDVLFKSQDSWGKMKNPEPYFIELGVVLGVDSGYLRACIASGAAIEHINADIQEGDRLGVRATPTFIVNGKVLVGFGNLKAELETLLKP